MNYYSIGEVAAKLRVHPQTLRNWGKRGLIKPVRVGRTRAFSDADLELCMKILHYSGRGISLKGIKELLQLREDFRRKDKKAPSQAKDYSASPSQKENSGLEEKSGNYGG
jgi:excisionase family DNA binding protein